MTTHVKFTVVASRSLPPTIEITANRMTGEPRASYHIDDYQACLGQWSIRLANHNPDWMTWMPQDLWDDFLSKAPIRQARDLITAVNAIAANLTA